MKGHQKKPSQHISDKTCLNILKILYSIFFSPTATPLRSLKTELHRMTLLGQLGAIEFLLLIGKDKTHCLGLQ